MTLQFLEQVGISLSMARLLTVEGLGPRSTTRTAMTTHPSRSTHLLRPVLLHCTLFTMVNVSSLYNSAVVSYCFPSSVALSDLSARTIAIGATHYDGHTELDMHNLFGHLMSRATNLAVRELHPGKRPFLISRSTFASSGRWTGHWVCGNFYLLAE
jgi:alpha-glucosidase (family GH31 glycosyl hydrolase)